MKNILVCTTNKAKIFSFQRVGERYGYRLVQNPIEIPESRNEDNAKISSQKATYAYEILGEPLVTIDSGLYIKSLGGFPKTFINFTLKTIGIEGIIKLLEGEEKKCEIRNSIAYIDDKLEEPIIFKETLTGRISNKPSGVVSENSWSKLHQIFIPDGYNKTIASMNENEFKDWETKKSQYNGGFDNFFTRLINKRDG